MISLQVVRFEQGDGPPDAVQTLLDALSFGSAIVGIYDDQDYLRYANEAFSSVFEVKPGEQITFAGIELRAFERRTSVQINAIDPHAFIADAQVRRRILAKAPRQRSFPVDFVNGDCTGARRCFFKRLDRTVEK